MIFHLTKINVCSALDFWMNLLNFQYSLLDIGIKNWNAKHFLCDIILLLDISLWVNDYICILDPWFSYDVTTCSIYFSGKLLLNKFSEWSLICNFDFIFESASWLVWIVVHRLTWGIQIKHSFTCISIEILLVKVCSIENNDLPIIFI
jgi:hypothetical protein